MPLIGTAGHVDHGKSTLIRRITGRDPDRWAEEKARGLTIDLGFAWVTLPDGTEVSFVDVPGHERFLKNMLAGVEAIDVALFVVAADEGWKPQSEEHLAVLDLLDVDLGVVALAKADLVDEDMRALVGEDVAGRLVGTSLEGARIIPVSSVTGAGLGDILAEMTRLVTGVERVDHGRPRLWVDRSFSVRGAGTIVTGSLLDGPLRVGDLVEAYPTGKTGRIRSIESHETATDIAIPGRRVALNLSGVDASKVARGDMIGLPGQWLTSDRILVRHRVARYHDELSRKGSYQAHIGSSACEATITGLDEGHAILKLGKALPVASGDRFIIRDTGRRLTVAGGRILDPDPGSSKRALEGARHMNPSAPPDEIAQALLEIRGAESAGRLAAHSGGGKPGNAVEVGETVISPATMLELRSRALLLVEAEHDRHPMRVGLPLATLAEQLGVSQETAGFVVRQEEAIEQWGPDVRVSGFETALDERSEAAWRAAVTSLERGLAVPALSALALDAELVHLKVREGALTRISDDLVLLPTQIEEIAEILAGLPETFTVADFRDAAGLTRKYAVPILEWADREGLTVRRGDLRRVR